MLDLPEESLNEGQPTSWGVLSEFNLIEHEGKNYLVKTVSTHGPDFQRLKSLSQTLNALESWPKNLLQFKLLNLSYELKILLPAIGQKEGEQFSPFDLYSLGYPLGSGEPWVFIQALATALADLHQHKIAHGNLKPGNIFLNEDGEIKLSDIGFGLYADQNNLTPSDSLCYSAPEQLNGSVTPAHENAFSLDVYSFGVIAYQILTQRFPRAHETLENICRHRHALDAEKNAFRPINIANKISIEGDEIEWPEEVQNQQELESRELVERCLSLNADDRPRSMVETSKELTRIRKIKEDQDRLGALSLKVSKKRRTTIILSLVAIAIIAVSIFLLKQINQQEEEHSQIITLKDQQYQEKTQELEQLAKDRELLENNLLSSLNETDQKRQSFQDLLDGAWLLNSRILTIALQAQSEEIPPLEKQTKQLKKLEQELSYSILLLEKNERYLPRAQALRLLLAEIKIHLEQPQLAQTLLRNLKEQNANVDLGQLARTKFLLAKSFIKNGKPQKGETLFKEVAELEQKSSLSSSLYIFYIAQLAKLELAKITINNGEISKGIKASRAPLAMLQAIRSLPEVSRRATSTWATKFIEVRNTLSEQKLLLDELNLNQDLIQTLQPIINEDPADSNLQLLIESHLHQGRILVGLENMKPAQDQCRKAILLIQQLASDNLLKSELMGKANQIIGEARMGSKSTLRSAESSFTQAIQYFDESITHFPNNLDLSIAKAESMRYLAIIEGYKFDKTRELNSLLRTLTFLKSLAPQLSKATATQAESLQHLEAICSAEVAYLYKDRRNLTKLGAYRKQALQIWKTLYNKTKKKVYKERMAWLKTL